ncbi:hypothetical protein K8353_01290 [Burkholderia contaminans]|nr:hypothetical protein [Burkholderia contaminans]
MTREDRLVSAIARHDDFIRRAVRMLAADARGDPLPEDALFHEEELKALDASLSDTAVDLAGAFVPEEVWVPPVRFAYRHGFGKPGMGWVKEFHAGLLISKRYFEALLPKFAPNVHYGDTMHVGVAGVVLGPKATAGDISLRDSQIAGELRACDLNSLADDLDHLRSAMKAEAVTAEQDVEVAKVASAGLAARNGDVQSVIGHLAGVGRWCLDVAAKVAPELATATLKAMLGLDKG